MRKSVNGGIIRVFPQDAQRGVSKRTEYRASALNLVVAAIILWNTVYLAEAVEILKQQGVTINEELLRYLSPLGWEHINLTGDYFWNFKQTPASGQLRPLRIKAK